MNFWNPNFRSAFCILRSAFDTDLHQLTPRPNPHIHAPCPDELSLGSRVAGKHFEDQNEIFIRKIRLLGIQKTADITLGQPGAPAQLSLVQTALLRLPLQCHSEITHLSPITNYQLPITFYLSIVLQFMQQTNFRNINHWWGERPQATAFLCVPLRSLRFQFFVLFRPFAPLRLKNSVPIFLPPIFLPDSQNEKPKL
jgi:hypothetical protein